MYWTKVMALLALLGGMGAVVCKAQNPDSKRIDHWYFGQGAGLDFSGGAPVADTSGAMHVWKGNTTMSDTAGNLLFYSDGRHVWNAQHDTMPNGDIWGIPPGVFPMDCAIAVPKPGDDNIYYIFTSDGYKLTQQNGLQYHIIDMSLDGGLGDVVQKNIPLYSPVTEQLAAVRHGNNCDYWLITHEKDTENHLAFHISGLGVDHTPVVSASGVSNLPFTCSFCEYTGAIILKASPQGDKLCSIIHRRWQNTGLGDQIQLSSFDHLTGQVANSFLIELDSTFGGTSFSPSGEILYTEYGYSIAKLVQFDLSQFDSIPVNASRTIIRSSLTKEFSSDLAIANDGKLYGCTPWAWVLNKDSLAVIHQPDEWGLGCMLEEWGQGLAGRLPDQQLPRSVADYAASHAPEYCWLGVEDPDGIADLIIWADVDLLWMRLDKSGTATDRTFRLYSTMGTLCAQGNVRLSPGSAVAITISHLLSAPYLLELSAPGEPRLVRPFVKPQ
ncbi:MAG TPA: hypothetical protein PLC20_09805 [Flavobacteriales bacterium]|nr:hypothetical protein [Flavobacteriales bacterium]